MKNILKLLGITVLVTVMFTMFAACDDGGNNNNGGGITPKDSVRYEVVPYSSSNASRSAGGEACVLIDSIRMYDADYYAYYMGYVTSVPVVYKDNYLYNGRTPITITFEKSWSDEETISQSLTKAIEHTWDVSASITAGVEVEAKAKIPFVGEAGVKTKLETTLSAGYGGSISTSNTYDTSSSKINGETQSISATIGENNEPAGMYRYALMGVTDVFAVFRVDKTSRKVLAVDIVQNAREDSYAWGIDYAVGTVSFFGKTGGGSLFKVPDIDFSEVDAPTETGNQEVFDFSNRFDTNLGTITILATVEEIVFIGNTAKVDPFIFVIDTHARNRDLTIIFKDMKFITNTSAQSAINDTATGSQPHTLRIVLEGENSFATASGADSPTVFPVIYLGTGNNLSISGSGNLTVKGGDNTGITGVVTQGGDGILSTGGTVSFATTGTISITGGNGGRGGRGIYGREQINFAAATGHVTVRGGNGSGQNGAGGHALVTYNLIRENAQQVAVPFTFTGGSGSPNGQAHATP